MKLQFSANAGFFGIQRNRFFQYQPERSLAEQVALVAQVKGLTGIELRYPKAYEDVAFLKRLLNDHDLRLSAVNVDTKDVDHFRYGALSALDPAARTEALRRLRVSMDLAAEFGTDLVTTCPLADGYDYPFQIDYETAWGYFIETVRAAAAYRPDIRLCLEYQPHEPHAHILLNNVGKVLYVCHAVGLPNVGANFDIGHSFAALENPSEALTLLARANRLFYIHTNDNTGDGGDWDMVSGTVHFWHYLEVLYTLDQVGYSGWLGGDITPKHIPGPAEAFQLNTLIIERLYQLLERVGKDKIKILLQQDGQVSQVFKLLVNAVIP